MEILQAIRNWSEVWGLLIPLTIILINRKRKSGMPLIVLYVYIGLALNLVATTMFVFHYDLPSFLQNNNILYNLHSFTRVLVLGTYIITIRSYRFVSFYRVLMAAYIGFVVINFIFFESPFFISSLLFSAESIVMLFFCISFFFSSIQDESETNWINQPAFLVCTGISFYEAITFFIFLFYNPLAEENREFGRLTFTIHNMVFVIFCIMLAMALAKDYRLQRNKRAEDTKNVGFQ